MRILAIADEESKYLWDYFQKEKLEGIDLILSSGDLNPNYLSFLATFTTAPVLYVRGNHDDKYEKTPPDGCICIEDQIYVHEGVRILGLGGSMRYRPGINQYTEKEMKKRVKKLWFPLLYRGGFDILLTHSPAYQLNDGLDLPHQDNLSGNIICFFRRKKCHRIGNILCLSESSQWNLCYCCLFHLT